MEQKTNIKTIEVNNHILNIMYKGAFDIDNWLKNNITKEYSVVETPKDISQIDIIINDNGEPMMDISFLNNL